MAGQCIQLLAQFAQLVLDNKVKLFHELRPTYLVSVECFLFPKVLEVTVVGDDLDALRHPLEVVLLCFEAVDDPEEFLIIDVIVNFGWGKLVQMECHRVHFLRGRVNL